MCALRKWMTIVRKNCVCVCLWEREREREREVNWKKSNRMIERDADTDKSVWERRKYDERKREGGHEGGRYERCRGEPQHAFESDWVSHSPKTDVNRKRNKNCHPKNFAKKLVIFFRPKTQLGKNLTFWQKITIFLLFGLNKLQQTRASNNLLWREQLFRNFPSLDTMTH